jgi:transcriptional regulator with XRE-family HTH domain
MNNLKKLRLAKNLTLRELADKVQINYTALSRAENGNRNLNDSDIQILTAFFNVTADYLLGLSAMPKESTSTPSPKEELKGVKLALYNQMDEITDEQAEDVLNFLNFIKNQKK